MQNINTRVSPNSFLEAAGSGFARVSAPALSYFLVADLSVSAGEYVRAYAYPSFSTSPSLSIADRINIGDISNFSLTSVTGLIMQGVADNLYDKSYEVLIEGVVGDENNQNFVTAWIWPTTPEFLTTTIYRPGTFVFGYEGSPRAPTVYFRNAFGPATDPNLILRVGLKLTVMPQSDFGASRIVVPGPFCMPPFIAVGPNKGTYIFKNRGEFPNPQLLPFPRRFRTRTLLPPEVASPNVEAVMFGGPWTAHMVGATVGGGTTGTWTIEHLINSKDPVLLPYTPPVVVSAGPAASCSLHTPASQLFDVLRVTQTDTSNNSATDILLEYPNA